MSLTRSKRFSIVLSLVAAALYGGCVDLAPPWEKERAMPGDTDGSISAGTGGVGSFGSGLGGNNIEGYAGALGSFDATAPSMQPPDAMPSSEAGRQTDPIRSGTAPDGAGASDGPMGTGGAADGVDAGGVLGGIGGAAGASDLGRGGSAGDAAGGTAPSYDDASVDRAMSTGGKSKGSGGATGSGGVVSSGGTTARGGALGSGGVAGGSTVGTGGVASSGGVVGHGGVVSTGGVNGTGGAIATGGSSRSGTGGTWSYDCGNPLVPPAGESLLVTDFSDWNASTETWGRAGGIVGRIFSYPETTATMMASVEGSPAGLHLSGTLGSVGFGGGGIGINGCASIAAFKRIEFTYYGTAARCNVTWMVQTFDERPTDQSPPGGCDRTDAATAICFMFPQLGVDAVAAPSTSPVTVTKALASFAGWSDARSAQVIGLQWQFTNDGTTDDAGVGCAPDLTVTSVRLLP